MMEIQCPAPDCQYKTPEMEAQLAMQFLMLHNANVHESANRQGCKPEAMKRPLATLDMTETAWRDFKSQWQRYKRSTGLTGQDITDQLISCCADPLRMIINSRVRCHPQLMSEDSSNNSSSVCDFSLFWLFALNTGLEHLTICLLAHRASDRTRSIYLIGAVPSI